MGGVLAWVGLVMCSRGWCAGVDGMGDALACVAC